MNPGQPITLTETIYQSISLYVALGLVFFAFYNLVKHFFQEEQSRSAGSLLSEDGKEKRKASDVMIKYSRPIFSRYVVPIVAEMKKFEDDRTYWKRKLIAAGLIEELSPDEFISMKYTLVFLFPLVLSVLNLEGVGDLGLWWGWILCSAPIGYIYPNMMVKGRMEVRQKLAKKAMPFIVDLLALSTEAGLDFVGAIGKVTQKATPSPFVDELNQVLKEMKVGLSRSEALREMAVRLDMPEVSSFVSILISADEMGASIGKVLRQQSEALRLERSLAAEKEGAKAAAKILGPMFLFILPAIFLTIGTPFVLQMMKGGGFGP